MQAGAIPSVYDMFVSFIGAFLGILWVSGCASALNDRLNEHLLVASLGATAVLIYGVPESPLAQPRCVIGNDKPSAFATSLSCNDTFDLLAAQKRTIQTPV